MANHHSDKMEQSAYEQCLDLISFYEVYCSPTDGAIKGSIDGYLVIGLTVAITLILTAIFKEANQKPHCYFSKPSYDAFTPEASSVVLEKLACTYSL